METTTPGAPARGTTCDCLGDSATASVVASVIPPLGWRAEPASSGGAGEDRPESSGRLGVIDTGVSG